ncbi:bifunctional 4-hydroxy-2-oxoglutarate aldolase/2-dehydro-3-deoxy-phosphogluconate aldolase [Clostridium sp. MT-14]|uniref:bifunctional 4-hydroxy-2-oxoglutarate aldolase/2-dehydro-3-deoxy-phosphogluconate aldolase n=1 Tax=unclassified Clostridium TaxID=2614128 RepID=UPI00123960B9|nr:bifunctional 4-hydroxy-2-oxoglutarate aldolase/2-dehydro-3-deoxy-phosphogluconate aldolase [Clostridium sp. HV4-5-A1G]KAA8672686.1 bifunctional 4-hydroxy-2-oxoglutarate aldolase/2-dehydro-3-deoxy-phosphogluconate aldolase [Clostridium sp. HV4-5-A1G]
MESIELIKKEFKGEICVGAGTVLTIEQVNNAIEAGADYIISPNTDIKVIKETKRLNKISIPGAFTPSEIVTAYDAGADFVKLFPAGLLGAGYIKAVYGPLNYIPLLAVGGVNLDNISQLMGAGISGVGVGGNLVNKKNVQAGEFGMIKKLSKKYVDKIEGR